MKKLFISVALVCTLFTSCSQSYDFEDVAPQPIGEAVQNVVTLEQMNAAAYLYDFCLIRWEEDIPENLLRENNFEAWLDVIRYCDQYFDNGDVLCETNEYDIIEHLLWPDGYPQK